MLKATCHNRRQSAGNKESRTETSEAAAYIQFAQTSGIPSVRDIRQRHENRSRTCTLPQISSSRLQQGYKNRHATKKGQDTGAILKHDYKKCTTEDNSIHHFMGLAAPEGGHSTAHRR